MRKPKKEKKQRRIGGVIDSVVDDISRVKLNEHLNFDTVSAPVEASTDPDLKDARAKMSAAKKAFMADPSSENKREAKAARELFEKVECEHFLAIDKDKAIRQVRNKMMSMELRAEDLKKKIQGQKMVRLDCQARADGKGIMKCDQQTMKLEGQCALAIHEADRYKVMLGHVISGDRTGVSFSESEDFGQACQRPDGSVYGTSGQCRKGKPISLGPKEGMPLAHKKALQRGLKNKDVKRIAEEVREKYGVKQIRGDALRSAQRRLGEEIQRKKLGLNDEKTVAKQAEANAKRIAPQEKEKKPGLQTQVRQAKARGQVKAEKDIAKMGPTNAMLKQARENAKVKSEQIATPTKKPTGDFESLMKERHALLMRGAAAPPSQLASIMKRGEEVNKQIEDYVKLGGMQAMNAYIQRDMAVVNLKNLARNAPGRKRAEQALVKAKEMVNRQEAAALDKFKKGKAEAAEKFTKDVKGTVFPKVKGLPGYDPKSQFRNEKAETLGSGAMGTVRRVKGPPPGIVKSGQLGQYEAQALEILKGSGVAPELYGQQLSKTAKEGAVDEGLGGHVKERKGYLGMSEAKGMPLMMRYGKQADDEVVMNEFLRVRKEIHTRGVAHNDMHAGNFFYDSVSKKGSLVDFGLAVVDSRAALAEAMGTFGGDWQSEITVSQLGGGQMPQSLVFKKNLANVKKIMKRERPLEWSEFESQVGIRGRVKDFDATELSQADAQRYINMLYEGL